MDPLCPQPADPRWLAFCRAFTPWALAHGARTSLTQARTSRSISPGCARRRAHQRHLGASIGHAQNGRFRKSVRSSFGKLACGPTGHAGACLSTQELQVQTLSPKSYIHVRDGSVVVSAQTKELRAGQYALDSRYVCARFLTPYFAQFVTDITPAAAGAHPSDSVAVQA